MLNLCEFGTNLLNSKASISGKCSDHPQHMNEVILFFRTIYYGLCDMRKLKYICNDFAIQSCSISNVNYVKQCHSVHNKFINIIIIISYAEAKNGSTLHTGVVFYWFAFATNSLKLGQNRSLITCRIYLSFMTLDTRNVRMFVQQQQQHQKEKQTENPIW